MSIEAKTIDLRIIVIALHEVQSDPVIRGLNGANSLY